MVGDIALARLDHRLESLALPGAQFHHVLLCPCTRACHESAPSSPRRPGYRDSEMPPSFKDAGDYSRESFKMGGWFRSASVMPAKAGIQTWPRVPGLWIPAFAGMTQC